MLDGFRYAHGVATRPENRRMESDDASTPESEVVDFDGHSGVPMPEILTVIGGYLVGAPPAERIIVDIRNGTVLHPPESH